VQLADDKSRESGLTPEQEAYFDRVERVFGNGSFSAKIDDARDDVVRRNGGSGIVKGGNPVIGFRLENNEDKSS